MENEPRKLRSAAEIRAEVAARKTAKAAKSGPGQARPGNENARGRRNAATPGTPPPPKWFLDARKALVGEYRLGRFRNWGGTATAPNLYGMTVTVPDPRKSRVPYQDKPYRASYGETTTWHDSPASARAAIEAEFVRRENEKREARLREHPLSDPLLRAALYRAFKNL